MFYCLLSTGCLVTQTPPTNDLSATSAPAVPVTSSIPPKRRGGSSMLRERTLRTGLKTRVFGTKIYTFETIDSTNNCAKAVAACGAAEGTIVFSEQQTSGKGRLGRLWVANANENLTFSVILRPRVAPDQLNVLP